MRAPTPYPRFHGLWKQWCSITWSRGRTQRLNIPSLPFPYT